MYVHGFLRMYVLRICMVSTLYHACAHMCICMCVTYAHVYISTYISALHAYVYLENRDSHLHFLVSYVDPKCVCVCVCVCVRACVRTCGWVGGWVGVYACVCTFVSTCTWWNTIICGG